MTTNQIENLMRSEIKGISEQDFPLALDAVLCLLHGGELEERFLTISRPRMNALLHFVSEIKVQHKLWLGDYCKNNSEEIEKEIKKLMEDSEKIAPPLTELSFAMTVEMFVKFFAGEVFSDSKGVMYKPEFISLVSELVIKVREALMNVPTQIEKPPLGIMPKYIWLEERIGLLSEAIERRLEKGLEIDLKWIAERNEHIIEVKRIRTTTK